MVENSAVPPFRSTLKKEFGYLSFQCVLANVDVIGIRINKNYECVIITYRSAYKTGFIYEGGNLTPEQVFAVFKDAPEDKNNLDEWAEKRKGKVTVLIPPKDNYVFVLDDVVTTRTVLQQAQQKQ